MRTSVSNWWKVAVSVVATAVAVLGTVPASAASSDEARLLELTNQVRAANGLSALSINAQVTLVAQRWATTLAERGVLSHNESLPSQVAGWKELGENVGVGGTVDAVHAGFVASPTHRANIVESAFTQVGFGIVRPDARIFVVIVYMQPALSATTVAPKSASVPATTAPVSPPVPTTVKPAQPAVAPVVQATAAVPAPAELSTWMVVSLEQSRSRQGTSAR